MGYKETVMSDEQIIEVTREAILDEPCSTPPNAIRGIQERAIANKQAKLTWSIAEKVGIQKVVGFVEANLLPVAHTKVEISRRKWECSPHCERCMWQAFLEVEKC